MVRVTRLVCHHDCHVWLRTGTKSAHAAGVWYGAKRECLQLDFWVFFYQLFRIGRDQKRLFFFYQVKDIIWVIHFNSNKNPVSSDKKHAREHFEKLFLKIRPVVDIDERHRRGAKCLGAVFKSCWRGPTPKRFMRCWDFIHKFICTHIIYIIYIRWIEVCIYVNI